MRVEVGEDVEDGASDVLVAQGDLQFRQMRRHAAQHGPKALVQFVELLGKELIGQSPRQCLGLQHQPDRRAAAALVDLDDALKTSEQELGFAQAQFGADQTREFEQALTEAKVLARQAFQLRQRLDDAFPETPDEHRTMTLELIDLAGRADAILDAQAEAFEGLREVERNAPEILEQVAAEHAGLAARIDAAEARIAELGSSYPDADRTPVRDAPRQARRLTAFAATAIADARTELAKPDGEPAVAVRAAQQAVGQVNQLLASVDAFAEGLAGQAEAARREAAEVDAALASARAAVTAAQNYITTHRGAIGATARTRISEAERRLAEASAVGVATADALAAARDAARLAGAALTAARIDVDAFEERSAVREYGRWSDERIRSDQADGASLGGILADLFFGDGGRDDGWSWGSGSGSSGGSGWWGSRPSGWGGSSRRTSSSSRRSSFTSRRSSGGSGRRNSGGRGSGRRR